MDNIFLDKVHRIKAKSFILSNKLAANQNSSYHINNMTMINFGRSKHDSH